MYADDEEYDQIELFREEMREEFDSLYEDIEAELDEIERGERKDKRTYRERKKHGITLRRLCRFLICIYYFIFYSFFTYLFLYFLSPFKDCNFFFGYFHTFFCYFF